MTGGAARRSSARAMSAAATPPARCAWRAVSSGNASKIPKLKGPNFNANQAVVPGSFSTSGRAERRNCSSSGSRPGFAANRTTRPTVTISTPAFIAHMTWTSVVIAYRSLRDDGEESRRPAYRNGSQQAKHHRTVDDEARRAEFDALQPLGEAALDNAEDLELFSELRAIAGVDGLLRPLVEIGVPHRAVVERDRRNATEYVVRTEAVGQRSEQALALRVIAAIL